jgi:hypothetical protein
LAKVHYSEKCEYSRQTEFGDTIARGDRMKEDWTSECQLLQPGRKGEGMTTAPLERENICPELQTEDLPCLPF